ncbi:MAG: TIGR03986 family CRISPR-associated RAMP protein [Deltaproteobacteria bacterium]|nr:TIGR03986 family CRISPR-associated RAMP protein [Deltaproteobacteria bacterium]
MQNKKRDWLIDFPESNAKSIPIPEDDVRNYQNDITRAEDVPDLISLADKGQEIPCFYVKWRDQQGNDRVSFGHTAMFRLAYEKTIGEHIPKELVSRKWKITEERLDWMRKSGVPDTILVQLRSWERKEFLDQETLEKQLKPLLAKIEKNKQEQCKRGILKHAKVCDFAEAIFGNEHSFAGRVFFEDAFLCDGQTDVLMGEDSPKIFSTPKPTTFQHYLVQNNDNIRQLNHYNSNAAIRGNKLYWHKSGKNWKEKRENIKANDTQHTRINPIKPETQFAGRIRFENLSDEELGALLFALELPEGCMHKLGMGKPLGMGSVKITPTLYLSSRKARYKDLFYEWRENLPEAQPVKEFKEKFTAYVTDKLGIQQPLWETKRLKELQMMLDYEKGKALEAQGKIRYMEIERKKGTKKENEFKNRPVLPLPGNV